MILRGMAENNLNGVSFGVCWPRVLEALLLEELSHNLFSVLMTAIHGIIECAHFVVRNLASEFIECSRNFGMQGEGFLPNDWHSFVRREIMTVVLQNG